MRRRLRPSNPRKPRLGPALAALLLFIAAFAPCTLAQPAPTHPAPAEPIDLERVDPAEHAFDRYYLTLVNDQPAGYSRDYLLVTPDTLRSGYLDVRHESHNGEATSTRLQIDWVETRDFKPILITTINQTADQSVTKTYRFLEDAIELTTAQNGRTTTQTLPPIDAPYLTSAQRYIATNLHRARGDDAFVLQTLDPLIGLTPYRTAYKRLDQPKQTITLADGSQRDAHGYTVTYSVLPGLEIHEWTDPDHRTLGSDFSIAGLEQSSRLADPQVVHTRFQAPELAGRSLVKPADPIDSLRGVKLARYELNSQGLTQDRLPPAAGRQSVELIEPGLARVTLDFTGDTPPRAPQADHPTQAHLAATVHIDHRDKLVRQLADQAVARLDAARKASRDPLRIAYACKNKVSAHLTGVTYTLRDGTASEAARTRTGDCTESAVLLAAMLRAHNIPSRCVIGLAFTTEFAGQTNVFAYHMWTQAWIQTPGDPHPDAGYWLDLDAALFTHTPGHIALAYTNTGEVEQEQLATLFTLMNDLQIKLKQTKPKR